MGGRINTIMQTCFFAISGILPREQAIEEIKKAIKKTYGKRGEAVVQEELRSGGPDPRAPERSAARRAQGQFEDHRAVAGARRRARVRQKSARPDDRRRRRFPPGQRDAARRHLPHRHDAVGEAQHHARNPGLGAGPVHPVRQMLDGMPARGDPPEGVRPGLLAKAPASFKSTDAKFKEFPGTKYTIQVSPEDCTGCGLCVEACPAKDKTQVGRKAINMADQPPAARAGERQLGLLPRPAGSRSRRCSSPTRSRTRSFCSRCLSSPAPAPAAARPPTSNWPPSSSATGRSSPTPPAAPRSTAATCPPPPTPSTATGADRPGRTRSSKTTPSSAWACG